MLDQGPQTIDPVCSVIIPAFDAQRRIGEAIDSTLSQECDFNFEVIVVDDGSADHTAEVVRGYGGRVQLIEKENGGPGSARNAGAAQARSNILVFLDADDRMLPGRLAHQVGFMVTCPEVVLTFGGLEYDTKRVRDLPQLSESDSANDFRIMYSALQTLIVKGGFVGGSTMAVRRNPFLAEGKMREDIYVAEDYGLVCKLSLNHPIAGTNRKLIWCRSGDHRSLMSSRHTYYGPAKVLFENIVAHGSMLTPLQYSMAVKRFRTLSHALIRYEWAFNGRAAVLNRLGEFAELLPQRFCAFWRVASLCPPVLGRSLRRVLHHVRGHTDHRWEVSVK